MKRRHGGWQPEAFPEDTTLVKWALVLAAERYDGSEPVNVGSGMEISIRDLAALGDAGPWRR